MDALPSFNEDPSRLCLAEGDLAAMAPALAAAHAAIAGTFRMGGKLLLCGNGGSFADALHISGELLKSFTLRRSVSGPARERLAALPGGKVLIDSLEDALPAVVLGGNPILASAMLNDRHDHRLVFAQECLALAREGDAFLGISTSGNAENVLWAASVAKAAGCVTIALTGPDGGAVARAADIAIRTPGKDTACVQENHVRLYHVLCATLEREFFA